MLTGCILGTVNTRLSLTLPFAVALLLSACTSPDAAPAAGGAGDDADEVQSADEQEEAGEAQTPQQLAVAEAEELWQSWDTRAQAASLLVLHYPGSDAQATQGFLETVAPAGLILMGDNVPDPEDALVEQTKQWQAAAESAGLPPLVISIDQEGGLVKRLAGDASAGAGDLRDGDPAAVEEAFRERGQYLSQLGVNVNFGIVADYTDDSASFIYDRVLGTTPSSAAAAVQAAVEGEREGGGGTVHSTVKHFTGHGLTPGDSHQIIPDCGQITQEEWAETAAVPFEAGINSGTSLVMMSHISCPRIAQGPTSLQAKWYEILRDDLGFDGVIIKDDMSMLTNSGEEALADPGANAVGAIKAGATLVLSIGGEDGAAATAYAQGLVDAVVTAVESGEIPAEVFHDAGIRALSFRLGLSPQF